MSNLSLRQEAINRAHMQHQIQHVSHDPNCLECKRSEMKAKRDQEEKFNEWMRKQGYEIN